MRAKGSHQPGRTKLASASSYEEGHLGETSAGYFSSRCFFEEEHSYRGNHLQETAKFIQRIVMKMR